MRFLPARRRRRAPSVFGGLLALVCGLLVALAPPAAAEDSVTDLGVTGIYGDLVAGGDKVAVSAADRIFIADTTGKLEGEVTGVSDAYSLGRWQRRSRRRSGTPFQWARSSRRPGIRWWSARARAVRPTCSSTT